MSFLAKDEHSGERRIDQLDHLIRMLNDSYERSSDASWQEPK